MHAQQRGRPRSRQPSQLRHVPRYTDRPRVSRVCCIAMQCLTALLTNQASHCLCVVCSTPQSDRCTCFAAVAGCYQAAQARAHTEYSSDKEAQLSDQLAAVRDDLEAALADKAELESALGLLDRNSKAQIEQLQVWMDVGRGFLLGTREVHVHVGHVFVTGLRVVLPLRRGRGGQLHLMK